MGCQTFLSSLLLRGKSMRRRNFTMQNQKEEVHSRKGSMLCDFFLEGLLNRYHFRGLRNKRKDMSGNFARDSVSAERLSLLNNSVPEPLNCKDLHKYLAWKFADAAELRDIPSVVVSKVGLVTSTDLIKQF
ncbi:uncharacterized protein LOC113316881 [Papaver somniferum]|uniref:uncharacterized protein LOC113316881 n=1 Tax=Papaver somniferum TaxID=3469 RepID=UPI000E6FA6BB|nr:uncharacterized protein LOC113316881 [Papaver somniferum]